MQTPSYFDPYKDCVEILKESSTPIHRHTARLILEDSSSPMNQKFTQKLFDAVLSRDHIDFDDIPNSKGDIKLYSGYHTMTDVLNMVDQVSDFKNTPVLDYIHTIQKAISNIQMLSDIYRKGFAKHNEYVMLEYNTYVYCCVEATTAVLYQFVDLVKKPTNDGMYTITVKNTKFRADLFYVETLQKFNNVQKNMYMEYRKFLTSVMDNDTSNFLGSSAIVGMTVVGIVAASIIPITRTLVNQFFVIKHDISSSLMYQAYLLQMNKVAVENNVALTVDKKKAILSKQEKIRDLMMKLADKLRVSNAETDKQRTKLIDNENKTLTADKIRKEIEDEPLGLL